VAKKIELSKSDLMKKHPSEFGVEMRKSLEYVGKVKPNEFLLFNIPKSVTKEQIAKKCEVKGVEILSIDIVKAICG
jgi:hypothetical protein